jgi:hypothetical protein
MRETQESQAVCIGSRDKSHEREVVGGENCRPDKQRLVVDLLPISGLLRIRGHSEVIHLAQKRPVGGDSQEALREHIVPVCHASISVHFPCDAVGS